MVVKLRCSGWCRRAQHTYALTFPRSHAHHTAARTHALPPPVSQITSQTSTLFYTPAHPYTHHTAAHALSLRGNRPSYIHSRTLSTHTLIPSLHTHSPISLLPFTRTPHTYPHSHRYLYTHTHTLLNPVCFHTYYTDPHML